MNILALDLGKFNTTCCVFDSKTRKTRFLTTPTQRESLAAMQELKAVHMPSQEHREFRSLVKYRKTLDSRLEEIVRNNPRIMRLRTIPGVGPRTAEIFVACIDDPHHGKNQSNKDD